MNREFLYLFLDFPSLDKVPDALENILQVEVEGNPQTLQNLNSNLIVVDKSLPIILHPPLKGSNWYIAGGDSNFSYHRRSIFIFNGNIVLTERYAADFEQFGPDGLLFKGDPKLNQSFYSYGHEIFSVANGKVIRTMDGLPDGIPGSFPTHTNLENIGGNYVLMKLDSGHYAFYAHLIPGSLRVKKGIESM